jgi:hypothetical protein
VKRGKRAQLRYVKGRRATLYALPGDKDFAPEQPAQRQRRALRGRRGIRRRQRQSEFLRRYKEAMLAYREGEGEDMPESLLYSTRLPEAEYLPSGAGDAPFVPGDAPTTARSRWKPSLRQRRKPAD